MTHQTRTVRLNVQRPRSIGGMLLALPLLVVGLAGLLVVAAVVLILLLVGTVVVAAASLVKPDLRRTIVGMWRAAMAMRAYRRWQRGPRVRVVDVEQVERG